MFGETGGAIHLTEVTGDNFLKILYSPISEESQPIDHSLLLILPSRKSSIIPLLLKSNSLLLLL